MAKITYAKNVFINCPFDKKYKNLRQAMIFTIAYCRFNPRCALEDNNSGTIRFNKIVKIIEESAYGIHDLSRTELDPKTKLPRFNMPLELGVFLGATYLGDKHHQQKKCLILDKEKYRYQKFISDIAGNDPESHDNNPEKIIAKVRNWLAQTSKRTDIPGSSHIIKSFNSFNQELPKMCKEASIKVNELEFYDYALIIAKFIKQSLIKRSLK